MTIIIRIIVGGRTLFETGSQRIYALPTVQFALSISNFHLDIEINERERPERQPEYRPVDLEAQQPRPAENQPNYIPVFVQNFDEFGRPVPNPEPVPVPAPEQIHPVPVPPPFFDYEAQQLNYNLSEL